MQHTKQRWLLLAVLASCDGLDEPELGTTASELNIKESAIWSSTSIPVCWESSGRDAEKALARAAVKRTWEATTGVVFEGWGVCAANARGIRIYHGDVWPSTSALGNELDGSVNGMKLNFDFTFTDEKGGQPFGSCIGASRDFCIEAIAVHEFGHALGFAHEQNRTDTPATCTEAPQGEDGTATVGSWDLMSAMNYCNPNWNNAGVLSTTDVVGARKYYGRPAAPDMQFHPLDLNGDGYGDLIQTYRGWRTIPTCKSSLFRGVPLFTCANPSALVYDSGSPQQQTLVGDFDGDNYADVAQVYRKWGAIPRCSSTGTGWSCTTPGAELHTNAGDTNERRFATGKFLTNDRRTGIIQTFREWGSIPLCSPTATGWSCVNQPATIYNSGSREQEFHVADVNGDGLDDVIQSYRGWASFPVCFANGYGGWSCRADYATTYNVTDGDTRFLTGDVNLDHRADMIQVSRGFHSMPVCTANSGGLGWTCNDRAASIYDSGSHEQQFLTGDFNGDGRTDVAQTYRGWGSIPVCYSTGSSWSCRNDAAVFPNTGSVEQRFLAVDMNHDGKTDIVSTYRGSAKYTVCLSTGTSWSCSDKGAIVNPGY